MIKNTTHPEDTLPPPVSDATLSDKSLVARGLFAARYCEPYHKLAVLWRKRHKPNGKWHPTCNATAGKGG